MPPPGSDAVLWRDGLQCLAERFTACCRSVDPQSTEFMLAHAAEADVLAAVAAAATTVDLAAGANAGDAALAGASGDALPGVTVIADEFGAGILDVE